MDQPLSIPSTKPRTASPRRWVALSPICIHLLLIIAPVAAYSPILQNDFVGLDDQVTVYQNPNLTHLSASTYFSFWTTPQRDLYAPLTYSLFALISLFARVRTAAGHVPGIPFHAWPFHAVSLLLHVLCVLVVYRLLRKLIRSPWPAAAGAMLFSLHPVQVETVAWVTETNGLLCGLMSMTAVLLFVEADGLVATEPLSPELSIATVKRRRNKFTLATEVLVFAMLSKPLGVIVPALALVVFWLLRADASWGVIASASPSPGTPGEGRGEGSDPPVPGADPHPNPLPAYREREPENIPRDFADNPRPPRPTLGAQREKEPENTQTVRDVAENPRLPRRTLCAQQEKEPENTQTVRDIADDPLPPRRSLRAPILTLAIWVVLAMPFAFIARRSQQIPSWWLVVPLWLRPLVAADALAFYLVKISLPITLTPDYGRSPAVIVEHGFAWYTWLLPAALGVGLFHLYRRRRAAPLIAGAVWFVVALLPVLGLTLFAFQRMSTVADRYLYLPMFGVALGVAWGVNCLVVMTRSRNSKSALSGLLIAVLCVAFLAILGVRTWFQCHYWHDKQTLIDHSRQVIGREPGAREPG